MKKLLFLLLIPTLAFSQSRTFRSTITTDSSIVGLNTSTPHWVFPSGTKPSQQIHTLQTYGGLSIIPDSTYFNSELNLYSRTTPVRGGGILNFVQWSPRLSKYISTFSMGTDYVQSLVTADSVSPVWFFGARSIDPSLPLDFYDFMSVVGYDYTVPAVGDHYRGEIGLGIAPPLIGSAISAASPTLYPSSNSVFSVFRVSEDSSNTYLQLRHGPTGVSKFELRSSGQMFWYNDSGSNSPYSLDGWTLGFQDVQGVANDPFFSGGSFLFQAKRPIDNDYAYLTVGSDAVRVTAELGLVGNEIRVFNSGADTRVINQWGSFQGDSVQSAKIAIPYNGLTNNAITFGTQNNGVFPVLSSGTTLDQYVLGSAALQGIVIGRVAQGTDLILGINNFKQPYMMRFFDSTSTSLKAEIDSSGAAFFNTLRIGQNGSMIDSSKVVTDTLWFYVGGAAYFAIKP